MRHDESLTDVEITNLAFPLENGVKDLQLALFLPVLDRWTVSNFRKAQAGFHRGSAHQLL